MKVATRIYLDAALQNIKSVAFFTFLQVLIARLGASNFQISLSNSLPPLFAALSLAFLTRQLPVTRGVYLTSGYIRQFAFLSMALSVLLPHPIGFILFFWSINAVSVMITSAQQPAIMRRWIAPDQFPAIFSRNKMIGIVIITTGSFSIGYYLDYTDRMFPDNYMISMLVGCIATFVGMNLIAGLAPKEKQKVRLHFVIPFRDCNRRMLWMALNNTGIAMMAPLFIIYHVKTLGLNNTQIAYFVVSTGIASTLLLPMIRRWMEKFGIRKIYGAAVLSMIFSAIPYGYLSSYWILLILQSCIGLGLVVHEVTTQSWMMEEASKHAREMDFFSDFQLVMNAGNAVGPLISAALLALLPLPACFAAVALIRLITYIVRPELAIFTPKGKSTRSASLH